MVHIFRLTGGRGSGIGAGQKEEVAMVDWTKPIEAVRKLDGRVVPMMLSCGPDDEGCYWTVDCPNEAETNSIWRTDGSDRCAQGKWYIRNRAEPANNELAELRAFKEAAIAKYPDLAPMDPDEQAAQKFAKEWHDDVLETVEDVARADIAWARANPR